MSTAPKTSKKLLRADILNKADNCWKMYRDLMLEAEECLSDDEEVDQGESDLMYIKTVEKHRFVMTLI